MYLFSTYAVEDIKVLIYLQILCHLILIPHSNYSTTKYY